MVRVVTVLQDPRMLGQKLVVWGKLQGGPRLFGKTVLQRDPLGRGFHGTDRLPRLSGRRDHLAARSFNPCKGVALGVKREIGHQGNSLSESSGRGAKRLRQPGKVGRGARLSAGCGSKTGKVAKGFVLAGKALQCD